ncbi:hypothetical protein FNV43_RR25270 [Rhamnella rubrinervis]|uniref:Uncharacterized protein n=1 Tax=Rhamnella rubrinervis TaxID=2594499 RepID=A0A8K0DZP4_9ROSA|nr:hypothetical protein FNV43_RR25270 [Rhamnella rubrinervis]
MMDTSPINWKCASKSHSLAVHSLAVLALFILQHLLNISEINAEATHNVHIVYLGVKKYDDPESTKKSHHKMLSTLLGSKDAAQRSILYSYRHSFSGFAARLTQSEAESIAEFPEVVQVIPNRIHKLHTTRSWDFIGIHPESPKNGILPDNNMGKGTIIGVIDSGAWPESESFNDQGMDPIPPRWKGICQEGEQFNSTNCNKKLIGARWFVKGVLGQKEMKRKRRSGGRESLQEDYMSARDGIGHGTHTASTAAGYYVKKANYGGLAEGVARGGAPLAHLAIYKACWGAISSNSTTSRSRSRRSSSRGAGCSDADLLKAFDKAIHDGVDILSVSIGNEIPLYTYVDQRDSIAIASFHAIENGITVVCSAGNDGPISQTISNTAPWLITVAATTIDRAFLTPITLGNNQTFWGQSINHIGKHMHQFSPLTYSERIALHPSDDSAMDCESGSLNATLAEGSIVVCFSKSEQQDIFSASASVKEAGGVGLVYAQFHEDGLGSCEIPCVKVDYQVGTQILSYIRRSRSPVAKLTSPSTVIGKWMSPRVASFSSRGPSSITPDVLKPDIAAPGVDILAAYPPFDSHSHSHSQSYAFLSGTSMSCPHVAGIAALVKSLHPNWSPAAIRSALVTTASQTGTDGTSITAQGPTRKAADPFDIGGGHVNPNKALDPGLIFNITREDYIEYLCSLGYSTASISSLTKMKVTMTSTWCNQSSHEYLTLNLNLPSITIPQLKMGATVVVKRRVTNVGPINSVYKSTTQAPAGIKMTVEPRILSFNLSTQSLSFKVTFFSTQKVHGDYKFGSLTWTDGNCHVVRSPIAIRVIRFDSYADV